MKKNTNGPRGKASQPPEEAYSRPPVRNRSRSGRTRQPKIVPTKIPDEPTPVVEASPAGGKKHKPGSVARHARRNFAKTVGIFFLVILGCVAAICVYLAFIISEATADDGILLNLSDLKTPQTSYIMAQNAAGEWIEYQKLSREQDSTWVDFDEISPYVVDAAIATEDRDFYNHKGVSFSRTAYAALNEIFGFEEQSFGASTINQQLVKNLTGDNVVVDEEGNKQAGYKRKIVEIWRAWKLDRNYSKDTILEAYLSTMPLSGTMVGVQAGARGYFGKNASELTLPEAALIVGVTQSPARYNPYNSPEAAMTRRNDVLFFMYENGSITKEEFDAAVATPIELYSGPHQYDTSAQETGVTSYFTDTVFEAVVSDLLKQGVVSTREAAITYYYTGGLRIYSTVDLALQDEMERVYELGWGEGGLFPAGVFATNEAGEQVYPQSAMAVVRHDGSLAGVVGGLGVKQESLGLNRATQSPRSIGSSMKPLTAYGLGIDSGLISYSSFVSDTYVNAEEQWPVNYGPTAPTGGNMLVCDALAQSLNTTAAHVGEDVGIQNMYDHLTDKLEITTLVGEGAVSDMGLSPLVLGGMTNGITALELAAAYTVYAGGGGYGVHYTQHCYTEIRDANDNRVLMPEVNAIQAVKPATGYIMNRLMSTVLNGSGWVSGTASGMTLETTDAVGKTGTTSDNKDRWFVGITPNYVTAVWWGYDTNEELYWSADASTNPPVRVWKSIMDTVQQGTANTEFAPAPEGVVQRDFSRYNGQLVPEGYTGEQTGWYNAEYLDKLATTNNYQPWYETPEPESSSSEAQEPPAPEVVPQEPTPQPPVTEPPASSTPVEPTPPTPPEPAEPTPPDGPEENDSG